MKAIKIGLEVLFLEIEIFAIYDWTAAVQNASIIRSTPCFKRRHHEYRRVGFATQATPSYVSPSPYPPSLPLPLRAPLIPPHTLLQVSFFRFTLPYPPASGVGVVMGVGAVVEGAWVAEEGVGVCAA